MPLWKIAWRSIQQRGLASSLTGLSMALGVALVVAVLVIRGVVDRSFNSSNGLGYNMVVGAKGGRLELIMNTVYYLSRPVENIPYTYYQQFVDGRFKDYVETAVPICMGDTYRDYRVIGTTTDFFDRLEYGGHKYEFAAGRNFKESESFGAVIGAIVAREADLKVGDTFQPSHGGGSSTHTHDEKFKIVGVLKPTGTPNDRGLFINMEGFYLIPEHKSADEEPAAAAHHHDDEPADDHADTDALPKKDVHDHADHDHADHDHADHDHADDDHADHDHARQAAAKPDDHAGHDHAEHDHDHADHDHAHHDHGPVPIAKREVTAVLISTKSLPGVPPEIFAIDLMKKVNKDSVAQAVQPIREMYTLFAMFVDPLQRLLLTLTVLIVIVSGIGILVSIYNSMSERRHEIAVMRALGAGRQTVMTIVLLESILLSLAGGVAGWAIGHGLIAALSPWMAEQTGVALGLLKFDPQELVIIPGLILLATLVGYLPAMAAYRTDVAKNLNAAQGM